MENLLVNHVALFRKQCFLTQTELSQRCDCSKNTISSIERYEFMPTVKLALKLSIALGCHVEDLFEIIDLK